MTKRFPAYPAVNESIRAMLAHYGIDPDARQMTDEDREVARRYNVAKELQDARRYRSEDND